MRKVLFPNRFNDELLDFPQYTRPAEFRGMRVPDVLLFWASRGNRELAKEQSLKRTLERRRIYLKEV